ncbi:3027_t:CDS:2, partial [Gigaspora margarita]
HLKKHLLIRRINIQKARSKKKNNRDDIPIIDNAYDLENKEVAETVFEKLIKNALNDMNLNNDEITQSNYTSESETEIIKKSLQWEQKLQETEERIQYLIDTNETSKTDKVKYISVIHYLKLLQNNTPKLEASRIVAHIHNGGEYCAKCIRAWAKKCLEGDPLPLSQCEKHPSKSLLYDKYISLKIANYLQATKFQVNLWLAKEYFEKHIPPELHIDQAQTITLTTSRCCMKKMEFNYKKYKKSVYVNGHKKEDIIVYHREFLQKMEEYDRLIPKWNINCEIYKEPNLLLGEKKHILITYNECVFYANDGTRLGKELHVSEFLTEAIKQLKDEEREARVIVETGGNQDENWDREKLLSQSHYHGTNALVAARMNLYPGVLSLQLELKGMKAVLNERGLWKNGLRANYKIDTYKKGLSSQVANYAVKKYKSHCSISRAELIENSQ